MLCLMHLIHHVVLMYIKNLKKKKKFNKNLSKKKKKEDLWTRGIRPSSHFNSFSKRNF